MEESLEYKRINLLGIPLDLLPEDRASDILESMIEDGNSHQIIFLSFQDFFRARRNGEFRDAVLSASMVLPLSRRLIRAAGFTRQARPVMYKPFELIIRIFGLCERKRKSAYLLGSTKKRMQISQKNLRDSFPGLNFVGRYSGFYDKQLEENIVLAIKKSSPTFLLAGRGLKGRDLWLYRHRKNIEPSIMLWNRHCYEIFAGKRRKPSYSGFSLFIKAILKSIVMPWRILNLFRFPFYIILLMIERGKNKGGLSERRTDNPQEK